MFYYFLVLLMVIIGGVISSNVRRNYYKYGKFESSSGLTGAEVAKKILNQNGIYDVNIQPIAGELTDHYDPRDKTIRLSEGVFGSNSISAVSIAAHEVGHAIQHNEGYAFLTFRSSIAPVVQFTSQFVIILILAGLFLNIADLFDLGIIFYGLSVLFHIITLPVEFDASNRAMKHLVGYNIITPEENMGTKKVLGSAALTYVASMMISVIQLLRFMNMRRD